jgi:simple sugar transport system substrate-binding protein
VGKFSHTVADDNAKLADRAVKAHPGVKAIFAPYDELTKGAVSAIEQNHLGSKIARSPRTASTSRTPTSS